MKFLVLFLCVISLSFAQVPEVFYDMDVIYSHPELTQPSPYAFPEDKIESNVVKKEEETATQNETEPQRKGSFSDVSNPDDVPTGNKRKVFSELLNKLNTPSNSKEVGG